MTEKEKMILNRFAIIIPRLSEKGQDKLLSYGEGMAAVLTEPTNKIKDGTRQPQATA